MKRMMRHTGGALSGAGMMLILIGALIGNAAVPVGAAQKAESTDATIVGELPDEGERDTKATTTTKPGDVKADPKASTTTKPADDTKTGAEEPGPKATTTTTKPPKTDGLEVTGRCSLDGSHGYIVLAVTVFGPTGASGTVVTDTGLSSGFTIPDAGFLTVEIGGHAGTNTVIVSDASGRVQQASVEVNDCKPAQLSASAEARCDKGEHLVAISVDGEPGATGTVLVDGHETLFTLDTSGAADLVIGTGGPAVTVEVRAADGTAVLGPVSLASECLVTTTTSMATTTTMVTTSTTGSTTSTSGVERLPAAVEASAVGGCTAAGATPSYRLTVSVHGDPGATGVVRIDDTAYDYLVYDHGVFELVVATKTGETTVAVHDAVAGTILDTVIGVEECVESEVLATPNPVTSGQGPGVEVLGQTELPFTGPHDGPIAAAGAVLLVAGSLLLVATRPSDEGDLDLAIGWTVQR